MARQSGLSVSTVQRIWQAFGLKPHRQETFKLSTDPDFVAKVRDVVGLYLAPPEHAVVLSVDEKSQIQALDRSQTVFPMRCGQPQRRSHDYVRHGALLTERQIRRSVHRSVEELEAAINAFLDQHNADPKPFRWIKSADDILAAVERFCTYNTPST
jgi:hypothetical protein